MGVEGFDGRAFGLYLAAERERQSAIAALNLAMQPSLDGMQVVDGRVSVGNSYDSPGKRRLSVSHDGGQTRVEMEPHGEAKLRRRLLSDKGGSADLGGGVGATVTPGDQVDTLTIQHPQGAAQVHMTRDHRHILAHTLMDKSTADKVHANVQAIQELRQRLTEAQGVSPVGLSQHRSPDAAIDFDYRRYRLHLADELSDADPDADDRSRAALVGTLKDATAWRDRLRAAGQVAPEVLKAAEQAVVDAQAQLASYDRGFETVVPQNV